MGAYAAATGEINIRGYGSSDEHRGVATRRSANQRRSLWAADFSYR